AGGRTRRRARTLRNDRLPDRAIDARAVGDEERNRRGGKAQPVRVRTCAGCWRHRRGAPGEVRMPTMKRSKSERGAALLEAAITIPMLLLVSVGIDRKSTPLNSTH